MKLLSLLALVATAAAEVRSTCMWVGGAERCGNTQPVWGSVCADSDSVPIRSLIEAFQSTHAQVVVLTSDNFDKVIDGKNNVLVKVRA